MAEANVCYSFEGAMKLAIDQERACFQTFKSGADKIKDQQVAAFFKELAIKDLDHIHSLEKAFYMGDAELVGLDKRVETMKIEDFLVTPEVKADLTMQDAMIVAMKEKRSCIKIYENMLSACTGNPMEKLFERLRNEDAADLQRLEDAYESHFMQDM